MQTEETEGYETVDRKKKKKTTVVQLSLWGHGVTPAVWPSRARQTGPCEFQNTAPLWLLCLTLPQNVALMRETNAVAKASGSHTSPGKAEGRAAS